MASGIQIAIEDSGLHWLFLSPPIFAHRSAVWVLERVLNGELRWWWCKYDGAPAEPRLVDASLRLLADSTWPEFERDLESEWLAFWLVAADESLDLGDPGTLRAAMQCFERRPCGVRALLLHDNDPGTALVVVWPASATEVCRQLLLPPPEEWSQMARATHRLQRRVRRSGALASLIGAEQNR